LVVSGNLLKTLQSVSDREDGKALNRDDGAGVLGLPMKFFLSGCGVVRFSIRQLRNREKVFAQLWQNFLNFFQTNITKFSTCCNR